MTSDGLPIALEPSECYTLLRSQDVGCIAFVVDGAPTIVPIAYLVDDDSIVVRTARESRLANYAIGQTVGFEAHELEPALRSGWSVVAVGRAALLDPPQTGELAIDLVPWAGGTKDVYFRIRLDQLTGRKIEPPRAHAKHVST